MLDYYKYVFFYLEQKGEVKKGTFDRMDGFGKVDQTVSQLRKQLFKATSQKK